MHSLLSQTLEEIMQKSEDLTAGQVYKNVKVSNPF